MRKKQKLIQKIAIINSLVIALAIPISMFLFITNDFDIRNFASSLTYKTSVTSEESKIEVDDFSTSEKVVKANAVFENTTSEAVLRLGYKLKVDERYLQFDPESSAKALAKPTSTTKDGGETVYTWENVLEDCKTYPCDSSILPDKKLTLELAFTPVANTSNIDDGKTYVYSSFKSIVATDGLKETTDIAVLPTTGDSELTNKAEFIIAEAGGNQSPVCDTLAINGPMNPKSILLKAPITFITRGKDSDDGIMEVSAELSKVSSTGQLTTLKTYTWTQSGQKDVTIKGNQQNPSFGYTFDSVGKYVLRTSFKDKGGKVSSCGDKSVLNIEVVATNTLPTFTTTPSPEKTAASQIDLGTSYTYTAKAVDKEKDKLEYQVVAKPDWLAFSVLKEAEGVLDGKFLGTPTSDKHAGTHPIVYSVTDGYENHYASQIWILRVNTKNNDTPVVVVDSPVRSALANNSNVVVSWRSSDANGIKEYDVYYTSNLLDRANWTLIKENLTETTKQLTWTTPSAAKGNFYIVVEATDKSKEGLTGFGISEIFSIGTGIVPSPDQDSVDLADKFPLVTNVTPKEDSKTNDKKPIISADIRASKGNTLVASDVIIKLDGKDISTAAEIRGNGEFSGSVLVSLSESLKSGSHKVEVSIKDSAAQSSKKTWSFTVTDPKDVKEPVDNGKRYIDLLGYKIEVNNNLALIGIAVLVIIILALLLPWLIYFVQSSRRETTTTNYHDYTPVENTNYATLPVPTETTVTNTTTEISPVNETSYVEESDYSPVNINTSPAEPEEKQAINYVPIGSDYFTEETTAPTTQVTETTDTTETTTVTQEPVAEIEGIPATSLPQETPVENNEQLISTETASAAYVPTTSVETTTTTESTNVVASQDQPQQISEVQPMAQPTVLPPVQDPGQTNPPQAAM